MAILVVEWTGINALSVCAAMTQNVRGTLCTYFIALNGYVNDQVVNTIMSVWNPNHKNEMFRMQILDKKKSQNQSWVIETWTMKMKHSERNFLLIQNVKIDHEIETFRMQELDNK